MRKIQLNPAFAITYLVMAALFFILLVPVAGAATVPGTVVTNTAQIRYTVDGQQLTAQAVHSFKSSVSTPATISLLQFVAPSNPLAKTVQLAPTQCIAQASSVPKALAAPSLASAPAFSGSGTASAVDSTLFRSGDAVLIRLTDLDQNLDPLVADFVEVDVVSGVDRERLRLTETGPSTGEFAGYIQVVRSSPVQGDCKLSTTAGDKLVVSYVDGKDATTAESSALVDPYGRTFDSATGALVSGVRVSLVNDASGLPATVFGDDGVSAYPSSMLTGSTVTDASGATYPNSPGQYRFPLIAPGTYRLVIEPINGYRYPSTAASLPAVSGRPWVVIAGSKGEPFSVPLGPPVAIDVPMDPRIGRMELAKTSTRNTAGYGDTIVYALDLKNAETLALTDITVRDQLPQGFRYRAGSIRIDGAMAAEPLISRDGQTINFTLASLAAGKSNRITYATQVTVGAPIGNAVNSALAFVTGSVSNKAEAIVQIRDELMSSFGILVGRVIDGCDSQTAQGVAGVRVQMEDGRFVVTDKDGRWHMERIRPGAHVVQVDTTSLPKGAAVKACQGNRDNLRLPHSQLLDLRPGTLWRTEFVVDLPAKSVSKTALASETVPLNTSDLAANKFDDGWLNSAPTENAFAFPHAGYFPMSPIVNVVITHKPGLHVELQSNGAPVSAFHFEGTKQRMDKQIAMSQWRGVRVKEGVNLLTARLLDNNNQLVQSLQQLVVVPGIPVRAELLKEKSTLLADGHSPVIVAVKMFDREGNPARRGLIGAFELQGAFAAISQTDVSRRDPASNVTGRALEYTIGDNGVAMIQLQPTATSGELTLRFPSMVSGSRVGAIDASTSVPTVRTWVQAQAREWLLVGVAEGTFMHNKLSQAITPNTSLPGFSESDANGGRLAFYAKGSISGDTLLTIAFDSRGTKQAGVGLNGSTPERTLAQAVKPDEFYTVYGDTSVAQRDGVSSRKLYLKIERQQFYALFGDFATGLTLTELGRFNRTLNGVKTEYRGDKIQMNAFVAQTGQRAVRDEILMDSTTGIFRLSQRFIQPGTDQFRLQVRAPFPLNDIVEERVLQRSIDYRLDYATGEVVFSTFARPLVFGLNRVILIADYETSSLGSQDWVMGGRIAAQSSFGTVGVTAIHDGTVGKGGGLLSVDSTIRIADDKTLRAEVGTSSKSLIDPVTGLAQKQSGNAWLLDYNQRGEKFSMRAYARRSDSQYGLNQQSIQDLGLLRIGAQARYRLNAQQSVSAEASWTDTALAGGSQGSQVLLADVRYEQRHERFTWFGGLRHGSVQNSAGSSHTELITAGGQYQNTDSKWLLRAQVDVAVSGTQQTTAANAIVPSKLTIGADYRLSDKATLIGEQQLMMAGSDKAFLTRAGVRYTAPWGGQFNSSVGHGVSADGEGHNLMGLGYNQRIQLTSHWSIDGGLQRQRSIGTDALLRQSVGLALTPTATGQNPILALDNYTAANLGATYAKENWNLSGFVDGRQGAASSRLGFGLTGFHKLDDGVMISAGLTVRNSEDINAGIASDSKRTDLRFASAYRPAKSPWSMLQRLDITNQEGNTLAIAQNGVRALNNLHLNYFFPEQHQVSFHHAVKWTSENFDSQSFKGITQFAALEARMDVRRWLDVGVHGFIARNSDVAITSSGYGASVGFKVNRNARVVVGFNQRGLHDGLFPEANWAKRGIYLRLQMRFDQDTLKLNTDTVPMR